MNHTWILRTPLDAAAFTGEGAARLPFALGVFRTRRRRAAVISPAWEAPAPFDRVVGSWNADLPPEARLEMKIQVRAGRTWSAWYSLGTALGRPGRRLEMSSPGPQEDAFGAVAVDTLQLKAPAAALRYKLRLHAGGRPAVLHQAAVTVCGPGAAARPAAFRRGPWVRRLPVRGRSQMVEPKDCRNDICSPTSLAAVLEYWGLRRSSLDVAKRVRDRTTGDFGNWTFNMAAAGALGLDGHVAYLDSLDDLSGEIASGRPVIVSLAFGPGELPGSPIPKTRGHLVVVSGFTPDGDVSVMDPAGHTDRQTYRVYDRRGFHRAWRVNKRGLSYLLSPRVRGRPLTVGVPATDLWSSPRPTRRWSLAAPGRLSQLLYGERVTASAAAGDWIRIEADEQEHLDHGRVWRGYPGWVRSADLTAAAPPAPDAVVRARRIRLRCGGRNRLTLSVGTKLCRLDAAGGFSRVRLLDGKTAQLPSAALISPSAMTGAARRSLILDTAELFLATRYCWGGRCATQPDPSAGVDCSGLACLAYRVCGLGLPRDAHDQRLRSRPVSRRRLKPGDLIFLTADARSRRTTHVMIYSGGDGFIESRQTAGRVLRCTFARRFAAHLQGIESGQLVTDLAWPQPRRRRIFFGTYF